MLLLNKAGSFTAAPADEPTATRAIMAKIRHPGKRAQDKLGA
jgi:hypothetical protein